MDHVAGPLHALLVEKEGRIWFHIICLKLYQFKRFIWWCLSVLEFVLESILQYIMKPIMLENFKKNHGHPEISSDPPLGGGPDANSGRPCTLIHSPPCRTPCRLFIHKRFWGPLDLHLLVWSKLGWVRLFYQWELLHCHGQEPSALCVKWPLMFTWCHRIVTYSLPVAKVWLSGWMRQ